MPMQSGSPSCLYIAQNVRKSLHTEVPITVIHVLQNNSVHTHMWCGKVGFSSKKIISAGGWREVTEITTPRAHA
jgi:hypothetical protein